MEGRRPSAIPSILLAYLSVGLLLAQRLEADGASIAFGGSMPWLPLTLACCEDDGG